MAQSTLNERVARLEKWAELHPDTHRLEAEALRIAREDLAKRVDELNEVKAHSVDKSWFEKIHSILEARVEKLEAAHSSGVGERGLIKYLWQGLLIGLGWLAHFLIGK